MQRYGYCPYCGHSAPIQDGRNDCSQCGGTFALKTMDPPG